MTLATRLSIFFLTTLALVLAVFSASLYLLADHYLHRHFNERLDTILNTISGAVESSPEGVEWEPANRQLNFHFSTRQNPVVWLVADDQGKVVAQSYDRTANPLLIQAMKEIQQTPATTGTIELQSGAWQVAQRRIPADSTGEYEGEAVSDDQPAHTALTVTVAVSLSQLRSTLRLLLASLVGLSVMVWLAVLIAGRFLSRRALAPVTRMASAAATINADDLTRRLPRIETNDELQDLNKSFNLLLDRLQEAFERQRRFTGDASHQLRTPLAAILGQVEVALRRDRTSDEYRRVLQTVQSKSEHLVRMVESLLYLTRADSEALQPTAEPLDLVTWLPEQLSNWSDHVRAGDIVLENASVESCPVNAQPALLGELLNILLDNACKYSDPGTPIRIRLECDQTTVTLSVSDRGCGIDAKDLPDLFVPFRRSEQARLRGVEGVGLGLSIAKRLAIAFGGELSVTTKLNEGSSFRVRLPTLV